MKPPPPPMLETEQVSMIVFGRTVNLRCVSPGEPTAWAIVTLGWSRDPDVPYEDPIGDVYSRAELDGTAVRWTLRGMVDPWNGDPGDRVFLSVLLPADASRADVRAACEVLLCAFVGRFAEDLAPIGSVSPVSR